MKKYVTPSLLNVNKEQRLSMANTLISNGIKWIHYDIMDSIFVPNTAIEIDEIIKINKNALPHIKDAHLMVINPYEYVDKVKNDVDIITFHYEAIQNDLVKFREFLDKYHHELKIGLAIKPNTSVLNIKNFLDKLSLVLVMSVEPGRGGQKFIESSYEKIKELKTIRNNNSFDFLIQVDGGINSITGPLCLKFGADAVVAGTYLVCEPTSERIQSILGKFKS
ncbi:ribulose-phosphate 3-epimerase [Mycoplasmopsis cynos]|uniref:ribulose-phosphate 3-epimerase n=1 Tax=Mycoplasmopsis cynos TaxID=171284 RepID=UPI002AFF0DF8|nr:ribulose-phosphate 3-epimerase [Mycoplasmopsis cynos]WQQ17111.1 ribulose-phosphate 3-epimerase [Mycoplasmopsis cynos]